MGSAQAPKDEGPIERQQGEHKYHKSPGQITCNAIMVLFRYLRLPGKDLFCRLRKYRTIRSKVEPKAVEPEAAPSSKWSEQGKKYAFLSVGFGGGAGGAFGVVLGTYEGFRVTHDYVLPVNLGVTVLGAFYRGMIGSLMGVMWPCTLPLVIARANFTGGTSIFEWNIFSWKKR